MGKTVYASKTNWAQIGALLIGIIVTAGLIPKEYEDALTQLALLIIPPLTMAFRSHFTEHPLRWRWWSQ